jgi:hypothetical protein
MMNEQVMGSRARPRRCRCAATRVREARIVREVHLLAGADGHKGHGEPAEEQVPRLRLRRQVSAIVSRTCLCSCCFALVITHARFGSAEPWTWITGSRFRRRN